MLDVGVDVDMDILHIASLARFLCSSHNFNPKPEGPHYYAVREGRRLSFLLL